jgi:site-specific recombinase XerD
VTDDELREVTPEMARNVYLDQRRDELARETLKSHRYRIDAFVEWCEENGIEYMSELDGMNLHQYRVDRREEDGLKTVSLQGQLSTLRQFLRICATVDAVPENLHEKLILPSVPKREQANEELLEAGRAKAALEYLQQYQYACRRHVELLILWRTSMRRGGLRALDLGDFDRKAPALEVRHRPPETPLKNGEWSERDVYLDDGVAEVIRDYIDGPRLDVTDDTGRAPLITTREGRISLGTVKQDMYKITRPCEYGLECPHDRDPQTCEAMNTRKASTCPSSRSPHAIRTGSVTTYLDEGTPKAVLADRVDMTEDTMDRHYDQASKRERMFRRQEHLPEDL